MAMAIAMRIATQIFFATEVTQGPSAKCPLNAYKTLKGRQNPTDPDDMTKTPQLQFN
jgi:hypothetical protein